MNREEYLFTIITAALQAGEEILKVYNTAFAVQQKTDNSPLTQADRNAHNTIVKIVEKTKLPIVSEEGAQVAYSTRKTWKQFWMVDPLDGTKEFVNRNDEFTVNIALIEQGVPTMGVIYVPVSKTLYFADKEAYKVKNITHLNCSLPHLIQNAQQLPVLQKRSSCIVLASRSHLNKTTKDYINELKEKHQNVLISSKGSSLKLCLIAAGEADVYPRFSPTMEWDIAAGHAIINAAGGGVMQAKTKQPLHYNKENLLNPSFVAQGKLILY